MTVAELLEHPNGLQLYHMGLTALQAENHAESQREKRRSRLFRRRG